MRCKNKKESTTRLKNEATDEKNEFIIEEINSSTARVTSKINPEIKVIVKALHPSMLLVD
jgi:phenylpyruvate tautomerase PptA (4-oxalocrotonate tautomerase family)